MKRVIKSFPLLLGVLALNHDAGAAPPPRFPPSSVWHQDISVAPVHPQSQQMIDTLEGLGGWGNSNRLQIDFSLHVHPGAGAGAQLLPVVPHAGSGEYYSPDCEPLPATMPVPADAAFEGQSGLSCDNDSGDCHLLVRDGDVLYELYNGNLAGGNLNARCLAIWYLDADYPPEGRGEHCTSADAAGFRAHRAALLVRARR